MLPTALYDLLTSPTSPSAMITLVSPEHTYLPRHFSSFSFNLSNKWWGYTKQSEKTLEVKELHTAAQTIHYSDSCYNPHLRSERDIPCTCKKQMQTWSPATCASCSHHLHLRREGGQGGRLLRLVLLRLFSTVCRHGALDTQHCFP